jgi:4-hydroxy-tetrahydrodipicolinate synthase
MELVYHVGMPPQLTGVLSPVVTPFSADLSPDPGRFVRHCKWLLAHGCAGLAVFGTNSEANSLSVEERMHLLEALIAAGVPPDRLMPGTGCSAFPDSVRLTAHAVKLGCAGVLMLPPFYYKGVSDDGLYRSYSEIIQRVGDRRLRVYLYHIPPVSGVPISVGLIARLLEAFPDTIAGIKDSSNDWKNTQQLLDAFLGTGFAVFAGSETFLLQNLRAGGVGCITAGANVNPHGIDAVYRNWQTAAGDELQSSADAIRSALQSVPMIPALKAVISHYANDRAWETVRPPFTGLWPSQRDLLLTNLGTLNFAMPHIKA